MSKTEAVHVRYKSLYISLPSSAKQKREMTTEFYVVWRTRTTTDNFFEFSFQIYRCVPDFVCDSFDIDKQSK